MSLFSIENTYFLSHVRAFADLVIIMTRVARKFETKMDHKMKTMVIQ